MVCGYMVVSLEKLTVLSFDGTGSEIASIAPLDAQLAMLRITTFVCLYH